jgi:hypothetical protein
LASPLPNRSGGRREGDDRVASPERGIYAGVLGWMVKSFACDLRPLRVNGVCAGAVDTKLWHRLPEAERSATFERISARLPVGRVGRPEDSAEACLYLMKTGFSTGETIVVDGGNAFQKSLLRLLRTANRLTPAEGDRGSESRSLQQRVQTNLPGRVESIPRGSPEGPGVRIPFPPAWSPVRT